MSGIYCRCDGPRKAKSVNWIVTMYRGNVSTFNGRRFTPSVYSEIRCTCCGGIWRTRAGYADTLPRGSHSDVIATKE